MKNLLIFLAILCTLLTACGDDYTVSETSVPTLKQHVFVLPDRFNGQPYLSSTPVNTVYLDTSETVKLYAVYSLDGKYLTTDSSTDYYQSHSWEIDGEKFNISPLRFGFRTPGQRDIVLHTVDFLNDTLKDTVKVFVNTPISLYIDGPEDGYNLVQPGSDSEVELHWTLTGADPWETAWCSVYASFNASKVWKSNIGDVDCFHGAKIVGPFIKELLLKEIKEKTSPDTSVTIYWGVKAVLNTEDGFMEADSTAIFRFSTRYLNDDSARITIPFVYDDIRNADTHTDAIVTSDRGDTLARENIKGSPASISVKISPQTKIHVQLIERDRKEFKADEVVIDALPGTHTTLDTIHFRDNIQPQVALLHNRISLGDSVVFYALDNGSYINPHRIFVTSGKDTLEYTYEEPFIKFKAPCIVSCKINVHVEDYARNSSPNLHWNISFSMENMFATDSVDIDGPFSEMGGDL